MNAETIKVTAIYVENLIENVNLNKRITMTHTIKIKNVQ